MYCGTSDAVTTARRQLISTRLAVVSELEGYRRKKKLFYWNDEFKPLVYRAFCSTGRSVLLEGSWTQ